MVKKVLITGIAGFAGSYLAEHLLTQKDVDLSGVYLLERGLENLSDIKDRMQLVKIDLMDKTRVCSFIKETKPDFVYHLAALTSPGDSFKNPSETITNNVAAQINLFEAIREANLTKTRILIISSADIYGAVSKEDLPIDENTPFRPMNPYAVSKITQDFLGLQYALSYNMEIIRVRPFNHIGPRQSPHFVVSSFSQKIAIIEKGEMPPVVKVGNLSAKRDFTDVRDIVRAYVLIMEKGRKGDVYNIGSGRSCTIKEILEKLLSFSKIKIAVEIDNNLLRPGDTPELVCDNTKCKKNTGWEPQIPIDKTLKDALDYWRNII